MKAIDRLDVYILGDSLHTDRYVQKKADQRLQEKEQILRLSERTKRIVYGVKDFSKTVEPQPNAPLLKRIIKNPKSLEVGEMVRTPRMRAKPEEREKYQRDTTLQEYFLADKRVRKMRPMELYYKAEIPERISVEEWLKKQKRES